jgi:hypothetical protein
VSRSKIFEILAAKDVEVKKGLHVDEILKRIDGDKKFSPKNLPRFLRMACAYHWREHTAHGREGY